MAFQDAHEHALYTRSTVFPGTIRADSARRGIVTDDFLGDVPLQELSLDWHLHGNWPNMHNKNYVSSEASHQHAISLKPTDDATTGDLADNSGAVGHTHTFSAGIDPVGSNGYSLRGGRRTPT